MKNLTLQQIASHLQLSSDCKASVRHFAIDSRKVERGGLFFALPGEKVDGHSFLQEVARREGLGAIVSAAYRGPDYDLQLLHVPDVKGALHNLARMAMQKRSERVIGITGSMGKTTTKEFLSTLLSAKYRVAKSQGNHNSQLTLPLTILNLEGEYDFLVLEMAMSQHGHITNLVQIAPPEIAVLTRIAPAGMEEFRGGLQAIAKAKAEIFSHPTTKIGVMSAQVAGYKEALFAGNSKKYIYGWKRDFFDPRAGDFVMERQKEGLVIQDSPPLQIPLDGEHLQENALAAIGVARLLGLSWTEIGEKLKELKPFDRRFQKVEKEGVIFIQDSYNANPESMCAALKNLPKPKEGGKVIGVLGAMPDLGTSSSHYHTYVGECAKQHLDHLVWLGEKAKPLAAAFSHSGKQAQQAEGVAQIRLTLKTLVKPGDVVLLKGGNSFKLWELIED